MPTLDKSTERKALESEIQKNTYLLARSGGVLLLSASLLGQSLLTAENGMCITPGPCA